MPMKDIECDPRTLTRFITKWIVAAQLPFTTVESPEFLALIRYLNPTAHVFKADSVRSELDTLAAVFEKKIRELEKRHMHFL